MLEHTEEKPNKRSAQVQKQMRLWYPDTMPILEVKDLTVAINHTEILRRVNFSVEKGKTLGIVGESGCGKSMTTYAIMNMLPAGGKITSGSISLAGENLVGIKERKYREIRGKRMALVMQDPFTSLNPMMRVGSQIAEALTIHQTISSSAALAKAVELLKAVGVPGPELAAKKYPHEMSGGQRQRVVIAMAFACRPEVLIADEPTTALDVTLQAQILRLIRDLQAESGTSVILISHDIQAIGSIAHDIAVFYAGRVVETGSAEQVLRSAQMPYTQALLGAMPRASGEKLAVIPGQPPRFGKLEPGCAFAPRCPYRFEKCSMEPDLIPIGEGHSAACWKVGKPTEVASC